MTVLNLPQVNFSSAPGYTEWQFLHEIYSQEFYLRTLIGSTPGIVDKVADPTVNLDLSRPLVVSNNAANALTLDITKGYAITPNYQLIIIDSDLSAIPLPTVVEDTIYVVFVEYALVPSVDQQVNHFNILTEIRDERPSNTPYGSGPVASTLQEAVKVVTLADFNNVSLFPEDRKKGLVVVAHCSVRADAITGQLAVLLDLTRTTFTYNRPWFSYKDISHTTRLGSGVETDTNPHALAIQDLSGTSGLTLYQQLLPRGGVYAKDLTYYGYPGTFCTELISLNRYQADETGEVTADPGLGLDPLTGRYFVVLTKVPVRMGSLYFTGMPWKPVPYVWKPGTRYLILGALEQPLSYGNSLTVEYFSVSALMPPQESLTQGLQSFTTTVPLEGSEWVYTGGVVLSTIPTPTLNLAANVGPIKKKYNILCTADGALITSPQNLVPVLNVPDLVSEGQITINQAPHNGIGVTWIVGLTGVPLSAHSTDIASNLNLKILVNGVDETGATVEEEIGFYASQWREQSATELVEEPLQFRRTERKYQLVNYVQLLNTSVEPDNSGNAAILSLWANIDEASINKELANVASLFWDGLTGRHVVDQRVIGTTAQRSDQRQEPHADLLAESSASFVQELLAVSFDPPLLNPEHVAERLAHEADDDRLVGETWNVFSDLDASGSIKIVDFTRITPGMTLTVAEDRVLTFVLPPPAPDPDAGEVEIPTSLVTGNIETLNNLVGTLNNDIFDSTWFADLATTGDKVTLTRRGASPLGFVQCKRQRMTFSGNLISGTVTFTIFGASGSALVSLLVSGPLHSDSLDAIATAVNQLTPATGVSALRVDDLTLDYLIFNGDTQGRNFTVTTPTGLLVTATVATPADPFTYTQPLNGSLPTGHLPVRYKSADTPWQYETIALQWPGVALKATITFLNNTTAFVQNNDQVEIVTGKILVARVGSASQPGEFVISASLLTTLENMAEAINDPSFASGCHAEVNDAGNALYIYIGGYDAASISLLQEAVSGTWRIDSYKPSGIGSSGSHGFLKSVYPLASAEWRYQLIEAAALVGTFGTLNVNTATETITITAHGLFNGDKVHISNTSISDIAPTPLLQNQDYYVIDATNNTFRLSLTPGGSVIDLTSTGSGTNSLYVSAPFGPGEWSPYESMEPLSPTAFKFQGPGAASLYTVQVRLRGVDARANKFSLYQVTPADGTSTTALDIRLTDVENELADARGTSATLNDRLSLTINPDGTRIQDPELTDGRSSMILPLSGSLKERLDTMDGLSYWLTGGIGSYTNPPGTGNLGVANGLVSGPVDGYGNANFLTPGSPTAVKVKIAADATSPLIVAVSGRYYRFAREFNIDFTGKASGDYYINAEIETGSEMGRKVFAGTVGSSTTNSMTTTTGFGTSNMLGGDVIYSLTSLLSFGIECVLYIPSLNFFTPITAATATTVTVAGDLPALAGSAYEVWSVHECSLTVTPFVAGNSSLGTQQPGTVTQKRVPIGMASWNGTSFNASQTVNFRYKDTYVSELKGAFNAPYSVTFNHNLGFIPGSFKLYYYDNTSVLNPILIENEAIFRVTTTTVEVKNRYTGVIVTDWSGTKIATDAYLRLVAR